MPRLSALLLSLLAALPAAAATPEEDVQRYIAVFQSGSADSDKAVDDLGWKGISDTRLFDIIEQRLLDDETLVSRRNRIDRNYMARMIKALGYSGQAKYQETISHFAGVRAYRNHAERALANLRQYERWNPIISSRAAWDPSLPDDVNRVKNMLSSEDIGLLTVGAKRVYYAHANEPVLLDLLAERLRAKYKIPDLESADDVAWMVKGIGKSGNKKYAPLLQEVIAGTPHLKVSREADGWLRRM